MSEQRDESRLVECSQCGKRMGAESDLLGTGNEGFVCECCYAQILYTDLKINCMELMDDTRSK